MNQPVLKSELASRQNSHIRTYVIALKRVVIMFIALTLILGIIHFPWDTDAPLTPMEIESAQKYYADAYGKPAPSQAQTDFETQYLHVAIAEAKAFRIDGSDKGVRGAIQSDGQTRVGNWLGAGIFTGRG